MAEYKVIARKYRPQTFKEVLGQDAIVTTLKNAIKYNRLAHAYLFSGSRGTGKTTLARVFAKAINCQNPTPDFEPCNQCPSCKEITAGASLDVLEIDGASNRGIEDIRKINETAGYAPSSGKYKIYIIDEVHMLTKEAFNALLKTLEEPPQKVKFFFATTEVHKVLPTILSRCQRFNLNRIPPEMIVEKLKMIVQNSGVQADEEALRLIAHRADGGLRDAESLFDQVLAFTDKKMDAQTIASILGVVPRDLFFELDVSAKNNDVAKAFEISHQIFSQGKDIVHFIQDLVEHFRNILLVKLSGKDVPYLSLSAKDRAKYEESAKLYTTEQCQTILDFLIEAEQKIRFSPSQRIALEALLMRIIRVHQRVPVDLLVKRLAELEQNIQGSAPTEKKSLPDVKSILATPVETQQPIPVTPPTTTTATPTLTTPPTPKQNIPLTMESRAEASKKQSKYDTLLQFTAVELEGRVQKKSAY